MLCFLSLLTYWMANGMGFQFPNTRVRKECYQNKPVKRAITNSSFALDGLFMGQFRHRPGPSVCIKIHIGYLAAIFSMCLFLIAMFCRLIHC